MDKFDPSGEKLPRKKPETQPTKIDLSRRRFMGDAAAVAAGALGSGIVVDALITSKLGGKGWFGSKELPGTGVDTTKKLAEAAKALERNNIRRKVIGYQKEMLERLTTTDFIEAKKRALDHLDAKLSSPKDFYELASEDVKHVTGARNEVYTWVLRVVDYPEFVITADSVRQAIDNRKKVLDAESAGLSP